MQTERVTFLTSSDQKAALDAFARDSQVSVGHVVREATSRYIHSGEADDEAMLAALVNEVNQAVPKMRADIADAIDAIERSNRAVDAILADREIAA